MKPILLLGGVMLFPAAAGQPLFSATSPDITQEWAYFGLATQDSVDQSQDWPGENFCEEVFPCACADVITPWIVTLVVMTGSATDRLTLSNGFEIRVATMGQPASLPTTSKDSCNPAFFLVTGTAIADRASYRVDRDCPSTTDFDLVPTAC